MQTSGVDVLAKRFRLALNRYIVRESASIKVCKYELMVSTGLFEETNEQRIFSIILCNYVLNFLYIIFNENPSMKKFSLQEIYNNNKTTGKNTMISRMR